MLKITDVDYLGDYMLALTFNNDEKRVCDLKPYLSGEVFGELLDKFKFIQYGLIHGTIEWANGADFAPEFLYEIGTVGDKQYLRIMTKITKVWFENNKMYGLTDEKRIPRKGILFYFVIKYIERVYC